MKMVSFVPFANVTRWRENGQKAEKDSDQNEIQFKGDD